MKKTIRVTQSQMQRIVENSLIKMNGEKVQKQTLNENVITDFATIVGSQLQTISPQIFAYIAKVNYYDITQPEGLRMAKEVAGEVMLAVGTGLAAGAAGAYVQYKNQITKAAQACLNAVGIGKSIKSGQSAPQSSPTQQSQQTQAPAPVQV